MFFIVLYINIFFFLLLFLISFFKFILQQQQQQQQIPKKKSEHELVKACEEIAKAAQNGYNITDTNESDDDDDNDNSNDDDNNNNNNNNDNSNNTNDNKTTTEDSLYQKNKTPLIVATCSGHKKMVWLLLQYGANQYLKDSSGRNALEWSAVLGNHELMQMLAQSRANFFGDARSKEGKASYASCRNGCGDRM